MDATELLGMTVLPTSLTSLSCQEPCFDTLRREDTCQCDGAGTPWGTPRAPRPQLTWRVKDALKNSHMGSHVPISVCFGLI